ncbi:hypothetical protein IAE22_30965, partial [Bacillus sp. S34]|nr:hypothetical protein [Bacillus sp. S34]
MSGNDTPGTESEMTRYDLGHAATYLAFDTLGRVWRWVGPPVALVAVVAAAALFHWYAGVADQVVWECAVSSCGTNDPRSFAPEGCWALLVLADGRTWIERLHLPAVLAAFVEEPVAIASLDSGTRD